MPHYCVNCGAPLVPREIEGRMHEACPNDDFVLWRDPKVVAAMVVVRDGAIALGKRSIEPGRGLWCLPGGFVNHDENPMDAAVRECREELGAEVEIARFFSLYHIAKPAAASMVGLCWIGRLADGARLEAGPEMEEVGFYSEDDLPELAFPSHQSLIEEFFRFQALPAAKELRRDDAAAPRASRPSRARARSTPRRRR